MRAPVLFVFFGAALAGGCGRPSPCDGVSGACIGAHISGHATGLRQLVLSIDKPTPETVRTPTPPGPIHLPARVALALPAGASGMVKVTIQGIDDKSQVVAQTERTISLPASGRTDADFTLDAAVVGGDGGTPVGPDMANGVVVQGAVDQTGYELEPLSIQISASDPQSSDLMLTAEGVPATATFTATGASATLSWTPTRTEAGAYPITVTATSASNPARTAAVPFTLTIKNTIDPVINPFSVSPDQLVLDPVGDVDGDGLGDFAFCAITGQAGQLPQYSVQIIYGDPAGLPTARPYPTAARTRTITFSGPAGSKDSNIIATNCTGGDFDGDGKSDVLITDNFYVPPGGSSAIGTYFIVYGTARDDKAAPVTAQLTAAGSDTLGLLPLVGDWNGDGLADFATVQDNVPAAGAGIKANLYIWKGQFPRATGPIAGLQLSYDHPCGSIPRLVGFAAATGANGPGGKTGHALVWYDDAVKSDGTFPGTCAATDGGVRVYTAGIQLNGLVNVPLPHPNIAPTLGICDVDSDGKDDLLVLTRDGNLAWSVAPVYGTATGWPTPVDPSKSTATMIQGNAPRLACWKSAYGPNVFLASDPGSLTSGGFLAKGTIWFFDVGASRVPMLTRTLGNFDANSSYSGFGDVFQRPGDINGDGKPDLLIGYQSGFSAPNFAWMLYGR